MYFGFEVLGGKDVPLSRMSTFLTLKIGLCCVDPGRRVHVSSEQV